MSDAETITASLNRWRPAEAGLAIMAVLPKQIDVFVGKNGSRILQVLENGHLVFQAVLDPDAAAHLAHRLGPDAAA